LTQFPPLFISSISSPFLYKIPIKSHLIPIPQNLPISNNIHPFKIFHTGKQLLLGLGLPGRATKGRWSSLHTTHQSLVETLFGLCPHSSTKIGASGVLLVAKKGTRASRDQHSIIRGAAKIKKYLFHHPPQNPLNKPIENWLGRESRAVTFCAPSPLHCSPSTFFINIIAIY